MVLALPTLRGTCWGHACGLGRLAPCQRTALHLLHPSHLLFKTQEKEEVVAFWAGFSLTLSEGLRVSVYQWQAGGILAVL